MLDQAWSSTPIDTDAYFHDWVSSRYTATKSIPRELYTAWDIMRTTVYNNTDLASAIAVTKSIFELQPSIKGLLGRTGHHPTTLNYNPTTLVDVWQLMYGAGKAENSLWSNPSFEYDMVDVTRQVMANAFIPLYSNLISTYNSSNHPETPLQTRVPSSSISLMI